MGKHKKKDKKEKDKRSNSALPAESDLQAQVERLQQENQELRARLEKIHELASVHTTEEDDEEGEEEETTAAADAVQAQPV